MPFGGLSERTRSENEDALTTCHSNRKQGKKKSIDGRRGEEMTHATNRTIFLGGGWGGDDWFSARSKVTAIPLNRCLTTHKVPEDEAPTINRDST